MKPLFVDTGYWIALFSNRDALHAKALELRARVSHERRQMVTTSAILVETVDGFAERERRHAAEFRSLIEASRRIEVVHVDEALLRRGWDLFEARDDKQWSLTDCISFQAMRERDLNQALAHDHHFVQAGFSALLRD